jgi:hypothetical protein
MFVHGAAVNIDDADPSLLSRMIRQIFTDDPSLAYMIYSRPAEAS